MHIDKHRMKNPIIPLYRQSDILIIRSENCFVFDSDNKRYIDFESGDWASNLGHSNPKINERIKQQVDILIHDGLRFRNSESEQLSLKLLDKLGLTGGQCAFLNSGSEAVNLGITIAKNMTGKKRVLKMDCSYLSAFGHGQISDNNSDLINIPFNNTDSISNIDFHEIAVFVFEPGNASSLIKYPNADFIKAVATEIKKHGGLIMANEVTTGFGRTGKWFGFQHYDYQPDIVSVGKALGNGYPISGVVISSRISELFKETPFRYAQSHQNDALGCAVGLEVISTIEEQDLISKGFEKGTYFKEKLIQLQTKHPDIVEIRARGLMIAIELKTTEIADHIYNQLIGYGFLVGFKEKTLRFIPSLTIELKHIDELIEMIDIIITGLNIQILNQCR
ncbi:MAG: aspartate aminotransferase family protein [Chitinispirillaceae bacterium]|nr:aspartate aminotransferase family protein [Chitinispirillaceae bacterium]